LDWGHGESGGLKLMQWEKEVHAFFTKPRLTKPKEEKVVRGGGVARGWVGWKKEKKKRPGGRDRPFKRYLGGEVASLEGYKQKKNEKTVTPTIPLPLLPPAT